MFERGKRETDFATAGTGSSAGPLAGRDSAAPAPAGRGSTDGPAVIGRSIRINGDLRGGEDLRIEGDVSGTVALDQGSLTIGKEGRVRADVYAKSIIVDGTMEGDLFANDRVNIRASAQVIGNVTAPRVAIEDGAKFKGAIEMDQAAVEQAFGKPGPTAGAKPAPAAGSKPTPVESAKRTDKAPETAPKEAASS